MTSSEIEQEESRFSVYETVVLAAGVVIVIAGIHAARAIVIPFLLAIFIGVIISAILDWLRKQGINTGLAIFVMMFSIGLTSLILISIVATSVNELVRRLPELNNVVIKQEMAIMEWLEERGLGPSLPEASKSRQSQSLEFSVPGLVPAPESSSSNSGPSEPDQAQPVPTPPDGEPEPEPTTTDNQTDSESVTSLQAERKDEALQSVSTDGLNQSNGLKNNEVETGEIDVELVGHTEVTTDESEVIQEVSEPVTTEQAAPPAAGNSIGFPGYIFGQQKHVIEFMPSIPSTGPKEPNGGVLGLLTPVQLFQLFLEGITGVLNYTLIVLLMLMFLLLEWSRFGKKLETMPGPSQTFAEQVTEILDSIRRYMMIKTMVSLLTGLLVAIGLLLLETDYALLWGVIAFLFNYIPTIGSMIAGIVPTLYVLVDHGLWPAVYVAIVFLVVNFLVGNVLEPRIMGEGLGLSTFVVFLSLIFWGWVLGPAGMLLAVPLTMVLKISLARDEKTRWLSQFLGANAP